MCSLIEVCCICFYNKRYLQHLANFDSDNITLYIKLTSCVPEMCFTEMNDQRLICKECCENMDVVYKFRQKCLRSKTKLIDYITQLNKENSNIYLTDINNIDNIKEPSQNNSEIQNKSLTLDVNEMAQTHTAVNSIQFESVGIKMERNHLFTEEGVEESFEYPLTIPEVNKVDFYIIANNVDLIKPIKIKEENKDIADHLQENCEKEDKSADLLANPDEFKIDIVHNRIESNNDDKNTLDHTAEKPPECNVCNATFEKLSDLETHMRIHKEEIPFECNVCKKIFSSSHNIKAHMRIHTGEKLFDCNICQKKFRRSTNLDAHMSTHTQEKPFECSTCQQQFKRLAHLNRHLMIHTGERPHECTVCQEKFAQLTHLGIHMRIHTGEKPHECNVCQKRFTQVATLNAHMISHTNEKLYECTTCQKKFKLMNHLTRHIRIHTGERPHDSSVCKETCSQSINLKTHMRLHTEEKLYKCNVCLRNFIYLGSFNSHMKTHAE